MTSPERPHEYKALSGPELFTGQALVRVEPSGRLSLPGAWRHKFSSSAYMLRHNFGDEEPALMLFTPTALAARVNDLASAKYREVLLRSVAELSVDKQHRIVIPEIAQVLGVYSSVAILGSGDHLSLMSEESAAYLTRYDADVLDEIV